MSIVNSCEIPNEFANLPCNVRPGLAIPGEQHASILLDRKPPLSETRVPHFSFYALLPQDFRLTKSILIFVTTLLLSALAAAQCTLNTASPSVTICTPTNGSTVTSPVQVVAGTTDNAHPVTAMTLYVDNKSVYSVSAKQLSTSVTLGAGQHNITVNAWDSSGAVFKSTSIITVSGTGTAPVSVAIDPNTATLAPGATQQFSATVLNTANTAVTWSVDGFINGNTTVGTITNSGLYTAPATAGTHNVVATSVADSSKSDTAIVTVTTSGGGGGGGACTPASGPPSVTICSPAANATVNGPVTISAVDSSSTAISTTLVYIDNVLQYSTKASSVNTQLNVAPGTHFLVVQFYNGTWIKKGENFTVSTGQTIGVSISPTTATIAPGATQQFTSNVTGSTNTAVNWSVDGAPGGNSTVGTVSSTGLYTAPSTTGTHTVTATSQADSSKSASAAVTVSSGSGRGGICSANAPAPSVTICAPAANSTVTSPVTITAADNSASAISTTLVYIDNVLQYSTSASSVNTQLNLAPGTHFLVVQFYNGTWIKQGENFTVSTSKGGGGGGGGGTPGHANVLTYHYDQYRRGANTGETTLTPSNVNSASFGKKYSFPADAQVYAQPLYMSNLTMNGATRNVVFFATENNTVYAYDADSSSNVPLWHVHLGTPITTNDTYGIKPWVGITGTPVIDSGSGTLYVVTTESGGIFRLHALSVTSGAEKFGGPVQVKASVPGTGKDSSGGELPVSGSCYQRPGLALYGNNVYIGFGHCGHGWVLNYNKSTLQLRQAWNSTPDGAGGALWMGGGAPGFDDLGNLFFTTGVDFNDPAPGYPDSIMKMSPSLTVLDYFKPANEATLRANDADLGSGGGVVMPDNSSAHTYEYIAGGKDGRIFVLDRLHMGGYGTTDNVVQIVHTGTTQYDNLYDTPTYWNGRLYVHPANDVVHAFGWSNGMLTSSPTSSGSKVYGVHGATGAISANGSSNGILWEIESTAYPSGGAAILHAYDATNVAKELYNSTQAGSRDVAGPAVKFVVPTVADGKVFVGTGNAVDVYGLLP